MTTERRRYFRIDDTMGLAYTLLGPEEARAFVDRLGENGPGTDYIANFDNRIEALLEAAKAETPVVAELVELLHRKLNFVIRQLDIDADLMRRVAYQLRQVNVSACGMAFSCEEPLPVDQALQLDLLLQPGDVHIPILARVIACDPDAEEPCHFVRLDFEQIRPRDQELLIQHIVRRQSTLLRGSRSD